MLSKHVTAFLAVFVITWSSIVPCVYAQETGFVSICKVDQDSMAFRQCLPESVNRDVPVSLTSSVFNEDKFLCANRENAPFYIFSCTIYGNEALWYFNGSIVTSYQNNDLVRSATRHIYPSNTSDPLYTLITVLEVVENIPEYNISRCVSTLIVQPFCLEERNSDFVVLPFNVTCGTFCPQNAINGTSICQHEQYKVAERPNKPQILANTTNHTDIYLEWAPPTNEEEYTLLYYTITLEEKKFISQITSFNATIKAGNYTVNVTATNSCGQESDPATSMLMIKEVNESPTTDTENLQQMRERDLAILGVILSCVIIALIIALTSTVTVIIKLRRTANLAVQNNPPQEPIELQQIQKDQKHQIL